jgi:hypothetical protein
MERKTIELPAIIRNAPCYKAHRRISDWERGVAAQYIGVKPCEHWDAYSIVCECEKWVPGGWDTVREAAKVCEIIAEAMADPSESVPITLPRRLERPRC